MTDKERREENRIAAYAIAIALTVVLCIVVCSCKTQYVQGETITKEVRVVERDTTIITEADSASVVALLYCDSAYNVVLGDLELSEGERINLEWKMSQIQKNGRNNTIVQVNCDEDSLLTEIAMRDSIISTYHERNIIEYVRVRNEYDKFTSAGFWILALILGGLAFKKFYLHV